MEIKKELTHKNFFSMRQSLGEQKESLLMKYDKTIDPVLCQFYSHSILEKLQGAE